MKTKMLILGLVTTISHSLPAQKSEVFIKDGAAIRGYDPVAYFKEAKPVRGNENLGYQWNEATWLFSSKANLDSFKLNPQKYAPQFGGYCAYGVSENHKAPTDPEAWTIVNDKLYLNYNPKVQTYWNKDRDKRIADANKNWLLLKDKE
ncbi:MAG: YHS domain-containing (seleno)protein [Ferruginibacter sp.]